MIRRWAFILLVTSLMGGQAQAIVIRHDVDDARYHTSMDEFPALATFYTTGGHGVLVADSWVLTAAHATLCLQPASVITVGGEPVTVAGIYIHPDYRPNATHDIALVRLQAPVAHIQPVRLYHLTNEQGMHVWLTGRGRTGNGKTGQVADQDDYQKVLRTAQNTITDTRPQLLTVFFDEGQRALPREGVTGDGDRGGPAYIADDNGFHVVGISSRFQGEGAGLYGVRDIFTRVSAFTPWIKSVMQARPEVIEELADTRLHALPAGLTRSQLGPLCNELRLAVPR